MNNSERGTRLAAIARSGDTGTEFATRFSSVRVRKQICRARLAVRSRTMRAELTSLNRYSARSGISSAMLSPYDDELSVDCR